VASPSLFGKHNIDLYSPMLSHYHANIDSFLRGINEGRQAAREIDLYLEKNSSLPVTGGIVKRTAEEVFTSIAA
jgi:3-keto-L-gulonate-6-phosphate decarboxylase